MSDRIPVAKTYKLFMGGGFPRSESGRALRAMDAKGEFFANYAHASRKDLRTAVEAARKAQSGWAKRSAFNRSQILFRLAENLESRRGLFEDGLVQLVGLDAASAAKEVDAAVDRVFWYAGWADKFSQVLGGVNPVALSYFNFSVPEPTGVVVATAPRGSALCGLVSALCPVLVSGNAVIALVEGPAPTLALELADVIATSDVPGGVVNILTAPHAELLPIAAEHMDVNALALFGGEPELLANAGVKAAENLKRVARFEDPDLSDWWGSDTQSPYRIEPFIEWKTAWHPIGV